ERQLGELASVLGVLGGGATAQGSGAGRHQRTPAAIMSCIAVDGGPADVCANCGKGSSGGEGGVKLKDCTACRLVKYCGVDCQRAHRKQHKKACKQRAAELKDEQLYGQGHERPEGHFCPICTLPISLPMEDHSDSITPCPDNDAVVLAMIQARVAKNDPFAINHLGEKYCHGLLGLQKDMQRAVDLWTEAAELGSIDALNHLGIEYESRDRARSIQVYEKAAMQGCPLSRHKLGCIEGQKGNHDRALRHFLISAKMGYEHSVETITAMFKVGVATKDQYAEALRGYQNAVEEMKSHDRDEASALMKS
ncbi:hypothetical protein THAOC_00381, partial [Thalassiosira oceanica]